MKPWPAMVRVGGTLVDPREVAAIVVSESELGPPSKLVLRNGVQLELDDKDAHLLSAFFEETTASVR